MSQVANGRARERRRFFAPEIVQSSAMDCGPAALACLLQGHGIGASYGRLREACQTEVDGTSIDVLEDVANRLGLEVEQTLVPSEHLLLEQTSMLPALAVVQQPGGLAHFVVVWRRHGPWVQIMDPASGRRFVRRERFERELLNHSQTFSEADLRAWLEQDEFRDGLAARLRALGADTHIDGGFARLIDEALALPGVRGIATLEAAARLVAALVQGRALSTGAEAVRAVEALFRRALRDPDAIPRTYFSVLPVAPDADGRPRARLRGAVSLRSLGRRPADKTTEAPLSPELRAALAERPPRLLALLWKHLRAGARPLLLSLLVVSLVAASVGTLIEALLLRSLFEIGRDLAVVPQRLGAAALLLVWVGALALLELPLRGAVRGLGRLLEAQVRRAFLE
jgi:ATP-binding cassette subfamily B protein